MGMFKVSFIVDANAVIMCPHGGKVQIIPTNTTVLVNGAPLTTINDQFLIAGCPFNISGVPHPCVKIQWLTGAIKTKIGGVPVVLQTSTGLCLAADQAPQGPL